MIVSAKDCWHHAKKDHSAYFDLVVRRRLRKYQKRLTKTVYKFLVAEHNNIRDGSASDFKRIQTEFQSTMSTLAPSTQRRIAPYINKIYSYEAFSKKLATGWCAYKLCEQGALLTCPYCNLSHEVTILVNSEGKIRPALDHFFDKATYPLFAISIGNLVPSCHKCNSHLKHDADFYNIPHLHPLESDEEIKIVLDVDPVDVRIDTSIIKSASIKLEYDTGKTEVVNSIATFILEEQYQRVLEDARRIVESLQYYGDIQAAAPDAINFFLEGVRPDNYRNKVKGKMIIDLYERYGGGFNVS